MGSPFPLPFELRLHIFAELLGGGAESIADLLQRFAVRVARFGDNCVALVRVHEARSIQQTRFVFGGNGHETMLVCMNELSRLDLAAKYFHFAIPSHGMH